MSFSDKDSIYRALLAYAQSSIAITASYVKYCCLFQWPSWSFAGALAEQATAEGVFFLQGEEENDSKRRAARLQRAMFMHPNLTLAAALGKPV